MNRYLELLFTAALALSWLCSSGVDAATEAVQVAGPNGAVQLKLFANEGRLHFEVMLRGKSVIEPSPLVITLDDVELTAGVEIGGIKRYEVRETYSWRGVHAEATNHCHGATIDIQHNRSNIRYTLELRAFDDGVAFRHVIPGSDKPRVPDEATRFSIPDGGTAWYHDLGGHYEDTYEKKSVADVTDGQWVAPPFTFKLPDAAGYASITEAALAGYSGMALQADGRRGFRIMLGHKHPISYPFELRYRQDIGRVSQPAAIEGTITSPWRVVLVGADLNTLVNSDVIHNLCPPPDPKLFPQGLRAEWIKPGRAVWRYLDGGSNRLEDMKEFSRLAGELGFEYHVVEGFWSRWSDDQVKELVQYSREHGVGLWFWRHSNRLRTAESRTAFFQKLRELGVVGAKIDFFDHEHREVVDLYPALLEEAAKHRIMVNFHGANKPSGEPRTWPNELIREGVRGMESSRLRERARHDATLPFTRLLAGHADYTPVHFGMRRADTTWAHQVATAAVFTAPLLTYGAHPQNILNNPTAPMIKSIPAVWDETRVLPMSQIGEVAVFARRSGDTWFLAVVNGPAERSIEVDLAFLPPGEHKAMLVRDMKEDAAAVDIQEKTANRGDTWKIDLSSGGGFVARFSPE